MAATKTKVLVADDEKVIANTLVVILKQAGFDARSVYSGEMAVEMAQSFQPDVLISDVFMTGITGIEAAMQVRSMLPSCQVLLFSGKSPTADLPLGEFDVFRKPIDPSDLLARLCNGTFVDSHESSQNVLEIRNLSEFTELGLRVCHLVYLHLNGRLKGFLRRSVDAKANAV